MVDMIPMRKEPWYLLYQALPGLSWEAPAESQLGTRDRSPLGLTIGLPAEADDARKTLLQAVTNQGRHDAKSVM